MKRSISIHWGSKHDHRKGLNTHEMVYKNTQVVLGGMSSINDFNK